MNTIIARLKNIRLGKILTIFLAGILVLLSTACTDGLFNKNVEQVKPVKMIYEGAEKPDKRADIERGLPKKTLEDFDKSQPGGQIQRESDLSDRVEDRLDKVKGAFDDASKFIRDDAKEAMEKHEAEPGPGLP